MTKNTHRGVARATPLGLLPLFGRQLLPLGAVMLAFWLFRDRLPGIDTSQMVATIHQVSLGQWAIALLASGISFWAVGRYDQVLHGLLGTGIGAKQARFGGTVAIAVAQFAGFGVLSGALVRWRLLPELTLLRAIRLSLSVSVSFLFGWSVVLALAVLLAGLDVYHSQRTALAILAFALAVAALLIWQPRQLPALPGVKALISIISLSFVDTAFACAALYALLPVGVEVVPLTLFAVFLISLGAGLIGGTPGGVGPFELSLLLLLPGLPDAELMASVLAFRIVYYVIPAGIGAAILVFGPLGRLETRTPTVTRAQNGPYLTPLLESKLWSAPRAEMNLIRQGNYRFLQQVNQPCALVAPVGQSLMMLSDPIDTGMSTPGLIRNLATLARQQQRLALIYKCSPRTAVDAKKLGWHLLPVAQEAWLRPMDFTTDGPARRQLRRTLKKASHAGVRIVEAGATLPLEKMHEVSNIWARDHGGEHGFTMGVFTPDYVQCQHVFLAYSGDKLIAFITLHGVKNEWTIDLMRHLPTIAPGTMQALLVSAIEGAAARECARFSLAAVPHPGLNDGSITGWLHRLCVTQSSTDGLRRFKTSFAPHWETLYCAAPTRGALLLGLGAVYLRVNRRRP